MMDKAYKSILLAILFFSCSDAKRESIEYIIYGTYAGECIGHCATMYKLEGQRLLVDTTGCFFNDYEKNFVFRGDTLSNKKLSDAQMIERQLPEFLLQSNSKEFGCPDCHDQGGIFIEVKTGFSTRRFYVDTDLDKIPKELQDYAKLIMKTTGFKTF